VSETNPNPEPVKSAKPNIFNRLGGWISSTWQSVKPQPHAWKGAAAGMLAGAFLLFFTFLLLSSTPAQAWYLFPGLLLAMLLLAFLSTMLVDLILGWLNAIPRNFRLALFAALVLLSLAVMNISNQPAPLISAYVVCVLSPALIGAAVYTLFSGRYASHNLPRRITTLLSLLLGLAGVGLVLFALLVPGKRTEMPVNAAAQSPAPAALSLPDPSRPGSYPVLTLTYGSGQDLRRPEFGKEAGLTTHPVDGTPFVASWDGPLGWFQKQYWGFDVKTLPVNGRVWYPDGSGPFPLILIVHGNHAAEDFSDPGYEYLGELLASRGYIFASVDQNFLNGNWTCLFNAPYCKDENDGRGWLLLEHIRQFELWNNAANNPLRGKVDLNNIALIGHSRGGEAVSEAAVFNQLSYYPDNANIQFDYGYNIRSVIAIAPVDSQYWPTGIATPIKDVNYFILQGSHDADVISFDGFRTYKRLKFTTEEDLFKAGLFIYGANHGQFNSVWGSFDRGAFSNQLLNTAALLPAADQQQIAKVYISAFLDATLRGETGYQPLFADFRAGRQWLPDTIYLNLFETSRDQLVANFQEDIDLTTASLPGSTIASSSLTVWREQLMRGKWFNDLNTSAVILGWSKPADTANALYTIQLPEKSGLRVNQHSSLVLSLADTGENSNPNGLSAATDADLANLANQASQDTASQPETEPQSPQPIDFSVVLRSGGESASLPISAITALQPQFAVQLTKFAFIEGAPKKEPVFQTIEIPLQAFLAVNPNLDPSNLSAISLVFDRSPEGVIALEELILRTP
jgi:hypothetical protein